MNPLIVHRVPHRGSRRTSERAALAGLAVVVLLTTPLTACSTSPTDTTGPVEPAAPSVDFASVDHRLQQVSQFGQGRAVVVAPADAAMVVATTIGVDVVRQEATTTIPTLLAPPLDEVLVTADASAALLVDGHGSAELWALDDERLLASIDAVIDARLADDGTYVDVIGTESISRLSTTDGSTLATAPRTHDTDTQDASDAGDVIAWFGTAAQALLLPESADEQQGEIWTGSAIDVTRRPESLDRIARAAGDRTGDRVVLGVGGDGRFSGSLVGIDALTGERRWDLSVGDDATAPRWDIGHDGRTLVVADMTARLIGVDGAVERTWTVDGYESVASVVSLGATPGYAIVRARGSVIFVDADGAPSGEVTTTGTRLIDVAPTVHEPGLVAVDAHGRIRQWTPSGDLVLEIDTYVAGSINQVAVSSDGSMGAVASTDGTVTTFGLLASSVTEPMQQQFVHEEGNVDTVAFAPGGEAIVSGISEANGTNSFDDTLSRWNLDADERHFAVGGIPEPIMGCTEFRNTVVFSPDGEFFVAPFHDFSVSIRDADDGSVIHEFPEHLSIVWGLAISPDGQILATSSDDWTTRIWDLDSFELISEIEAPPGGYLSVAFTADGSSLVVSEVSGRMSVLDLADGSLSTLDGESAPGSRMAVSNDGRYVAAGADDHGTVNIWDIETGEIVQQVVGHGATVTSVVFTPDGLGLVTGSADGTARLWRVDAAPGVDRSAT